MSRGTVDLSHEQMDELVEAFNTIQDMATIGHTKIKVFPDDGSEYNCIHCGNPFHKDTDSIINTRISKTTFHESDGNDFTEIPGKSSTIEVVNDSAEIDRSHVNFKCSNSIQVEENSFVDQYQSIRSENSKVFSSPSTVEERPTAASDANLLRESTLPMKNQYHEEGITVSNADLLREVTLPVKVFNDSVEVDKNQVNFKRSNSKQVDEKCLIGQYQSIQLENSKVFYSQSTVENTPTAASDADLLRESTLPVKSQDTVEKTPTVASDADLSRESTLPVKSQDSVEKTPTAASDADLLRESTLPVKSQDSVEKTPTAASDADLSRESTLPVKSQDSVEKTPTAASDAGLLRESTIPVKSQDSVEKTPTAASDADLSRESTLPVKSQDPVGETPTAASDAGLVWSFLRHCLVCASFFAFVSVLLGNFSPLVAADSAKHAKIEACTGNPFMLIDAYFDNLDLILGCKCLFSNCTDTARWEKNGNPIAATSSNGERKEYKNGKYIAIADECFFLIVKNITNEDLTSPYYLFLGFMDAISFQPSIYPILSKRNSSMEVGCIKKSGSAELRLQLYHKAKNVRFFVDVKDRGTAIVEPQTIEHKIDGGVIYESNLHIKDLYTTSNNSIAIVFTSHTLKENITVYQKEIPLCLVATDMNNDGMDNGEEKRNKGVIIGVCVPVGILVIVLILVWFCRRKRQGKTKKKNAGESKELDSIKKNGRVSKNCQDGDYDKKNGKENGEVGPDEEMKLIRSEEASTPYQNGDLGNKQRGSSDVDVQYGSKDQISNSVLPAIAETRSDQQMNDSTIVLISNNQYVEMEKSV